MKINSHFVVREVGGEYIAVPIGEMSKKFRGMLKLNTTSKFLWDYFHEEHTAQEAAKALLDAYDVTPEQAQQAAEDFIGQMPEIIRA